MPTYHTVLILEENKEKWSTELKGRIQTYTESNINQLYNDLSKLEGERQESQIEIDKLKF